MSTFTTNIDLEQPALGADVNSWDVPLNSNFGITDQVIGSSTTVAATGSSITLTVPQAAFHTIIITGALSGGFQLILPGTIGGRRYIWNQTTGSQTVTVLNGAGDTGGGVIVPNGLLCPVILTGGQAYYDSYQSVPPGVVFNYTGAVAPPGWLLTYGQSLPVSSFPLLFNVLGYSQGGVGANFNNIDTRGRVLAGADNMGGSAAGRLTGYTLGTVGGNQAITLSTGQLPAHNHPITDPGHTHTITDGGHVHGTGVGGASFVTEGGAGPGSLTVGSAGNNVATTASATTGISGANSNTTGITTQNTGSGSSVPTVQPTFAVFHIIRF